MYLKFIAFPEGGRAVLRLTLLVTLLCSPLLCLAFESKAGSAMASEGGGRTTTLVAVDSRSGTAVFRVEGGLVSSYLGEVVAGTTFFLDAISSDAALLRSTAGARKGRTRRLLLAVGSPVPREFEGESVSDSAAIEVISASEPGNLNESVH